MSRYIRAQTPGATYFFTVTLEDRRASWLVDHIDLLRESVALVKRRHPFDIDAMVVLPDHIHALWTLPLADANFAMRWMLVKQLFTKKLRAKRAEAGSGRSRGKGEVDIWQRRYWEHLIKDDDDYANHVEYVHFNPVKHGWVRQVKDWPHSSFHQWVRDGRVHVDWGLAVATDGRFGE